MQIQVKAVKVLKTGKNDYGDWKLVLITTVEDIKYTTLAKDAEAITTGSTINITDMDKDDQNRESFKKFEVIEAGQVESPPGEGMTNEMWEEKAKIERHSIESQTRSKGIIELWIAGKIKDDDLLVTKLRVWLARLGSTSVPTSSPKEETTLDEDFDKLVSPPEKKGEAPSLKDLDELYARASKFGLSTRDVLVAVQEANPKITKEAEITDYDEAWKATAKKFAASIKAAQEAK